MKDRPSCENCHYFKLDAELIRECKEFLEAGKSIPDGTCRFERPKIVSGIFPGWGVWPSVQKDDWCADWEDETPYAYTREKNETI